jgi:transcriptional regulator with XRE-family HTH domain
MRRVKKTVDEGTRHLHAPRSRIAELADFLLHKPAASEPNSLQIWEALHLLFTNAVSGQEVSDPRAHLLSIWHSLPRFSDLWWHAAIAIEATQRGGLVLVGQCQRDGCENFALLLKRFGKKYLLLCPLHEIMPRSNRLGRYLKRWRRNVGLSAKDVADTLGKWTEEHLYLVEKGERILRPNDIKGLAQHFDNIDLYKAIFLGALDCLESRGWEEVKELFPQDLCEDYSDACHIIENEGLGHYVERLRKEAKISTHEVKCRAGLSPAALRKVEVGALKLQPRYIEPLAKALSIPAGFLGLLAELDSIAREKELYEANDCKYPLRFLPRRQRYQATDG